MSCPNESFFERDQKCKYTAKCKIARRDLEAAAKNGEEIKVSELSERGEKGFYDLS